MCGSVGVLFKPVRKLSVVFPPLIVAPVYSISDIILSVQQTPYFIYSILLKERVYFNTFS